MDKQVTLTIVVNGQPTQIVASGNVAVGSLIPRALQQTGNAGQPPENWELRGANGQPIDLDEEAEEFAGQTLFLNLKAGIGGDS
jgi:hypothetical protein